MELIIKLCSAFFFAYYFVNIALIPSKIKTIFKMRIGFRMKPFDCVTCLSAWTGCALYFMPIEISQFMLVMFGAGYIGAKVK